MEQKPGVETVHITRLLHVHTDSKVQSRVGGGGWSKASQGPWLRSTSKHLRLQRWRQQLVLHVVGVDGRRGGGRAGVAGRGGGGVLSLCREALQHAVHLLLHLVRPVDEVVLQLPSLLHDPLLPLAQPRQQVQPLVHLAQGGAARGAGRGAAGLRPVGGGLARHVELELLGAQVQRLAVQLLDEGHCTTLGR